MLNIFKKKEEKILENLMNYPTQNYDGFTIEELNEFIKENKIKINLNELKPGFFKQKTPIYYVYDIWKCIKYTKRD